MSMFHNMNVDDYRKPDRDISPIFINRWFPAGDVRLGDPQGRAHATGRGRAVCAVIQEGFFA